jgi:hypothetical protein
MVDFRNKPFYPQPLRWRLAIAHIGAEPVSCDARYGYAARRKRPGTDISQKHGAPINSDEAEFEMTYSADGKTVLFVPT